MKTAVGIFADRPGAERAVDELLDQGFPRDRVTLLAPGMRTTSETMPTAEGEAPGTGTAIGATVGTAVGGAAGIAGAALATFMVPGVGPVIAAGLLGAAIAGAGGAAVGAAIENALTEGVPRDEALVYMTAVRRGRSVVVVLADDENRAETARATLAAAGADSLDAARDQWWEELRTSERDRYVASGGDFATDEARYRAGFETALRCRPAARSYAEAEGELRRLAPDVYTDAAFRRGFERGLAYRDTLRAVRAA